MFPTNMFASSTQRKILRVLAETNRMYTVDELAELCHRSPSSISRALGQAHRYPFIEKDRVPGSKQLTFRLDPESPYSAAIRDFFEIEHDRERQNGTVPVDVWNLLEEVTDRLEDAVSGFVECFLFGSYATGEYYAGSDIDLLLVHTDSERERVPVDRVIEQVGDDRLQIIPVHVSDRDVSRADAELVDLVRTRSPVDGTDVLVPLTGEVSA